MEQARWPKGLIRWSIAPVCLALAACGGEADVAEPPVERAAGTGQGAPIEADVPVMGAERRILAFGDSLFAGYNVDPSDSYPAKLQSALRARGVNASVANAGVSGDTSAAGRQRFAFTLDAQEETPDLLILELGGNDLLRGISPTETRANLAAIIEAVRARDIDVLLMGMQAPGNMGPRFVRDFGAVYPSLAQEYGIELIPFWVQSVANRPDLVQRDRIHPTAEGIEVLVGDTVDEVVQALPEE